MSQIIKFDPRGRPELPQVSQDELIDIFERNITHSVVLSENELPERLKLERKP